MTITVNDAILKQFSDRYPLHEIVFVRATVAIAFSLAMLRFEGGLRALRTRRPGAHIARGLCMVVANMTFFAALAAIPLADATALFFVAPLFIRPFSPSRSSARRWGSAASWRSRSDSSACWWCSGREAPGSDFPSTG